jgi:membrane protease YdiL (CAAX protease family)
MSDAPPPVNPDLAAPLPPPAQPPEREPFWGYSDLLFMLGITLPCMFLGILLVKSAMYVFHWHPAVSVEELLPEQSLGYVLLFFSMYAMFRAQYGRPFWESLGWKPMRLPIGMVAIAGIAAAIGVAFSSALLRTPDTANPMTEMMQDRVSLILLAIFGVTVAPLSEELAFRGFLQPLLVRTAGPVLGILGAAIPFGLLHYHEYGNSWRHAVVISLAGATFGIMRHVTGSTKAATFMHASYNAFLFIALFAQRKDLPHLW